MKYLFSILKIITPVLILIILGNSFYGNKIDRVTLGSDLLLSKHLQLIENKSIGIVTNHTGVLSNGVHLADTLNAIPTIHVKALFGPEHGIRGNAPDGETIQDGIDTKTGVKTYSLYGEIRQPTEQMLNGIDVLIFDIQDIGARYYTFISTLYYTLNAAAENKIKIIVLDRPNPIGGEIVEGPLRKDEFKSFIAIAPIPIRHGMTIGELAELFNGENWLECGKQADLTVIRMKNWKRNEYYDSTGLKWIDPSPNMISLESAVLYPGLCLIEGTNISEGRGTYSPFLQIGAPFIDANQLTAALSQYQNKSLKISPIEFTPESISNMSKYPKYQNEKCFGVKFSISDFHNFNSLDFGIYLLSTLNKMYPEKFVFKKNNWIDKLFGNTYLREMILEGKAKEEISSVWKSDLENFKKLRKKYLLY